MGNLVSMSTALSRTQGPDYAAMRQRMAESALKKMDTDGSGSVSQAEFGKAAAKLPPQRLEAGAAATKATADEVFVLADTDKSGALSTDEIAALAATPTRSRGGADGANGAAVPPRGGKTRPAGGGPPPNGGAADGATTTSSSTSTDPADTDGDGTVSSNERTTYDLKMMLASYQKADASMESSSVESSVDVLA